MMSLVHNAIKVIFDCGTNSVAQYTSGLKILASHRTMSGQDDYLSGQNLGLVVILTGQVRGFRIIHFSLFPTY